MRNRGFYSTGSQRSVPRLCRVFRGNTGAYGEDDFLIDNSIDRYCINDRSDFKLNADGTLDIILSKDAPEDTSNWLPVSDGEFHLFMRIYVPDMTALDSWQPPVIREQ